MPIPNDRAQQRGEASFEAFENTLRLIEDETGTETIGCYGMATQYENGCAVSSIFDPRLEADDLGTMIGTLVGMHAAQHGWSPDDLASFLTRVANSKSRLSEDRVIPGEEQA